MNRMVLLVLLGCGSKEDETTDDDDVVSSIPDVSGRYNTQIAAATGCEGESHWIEGWAPGPLTISESDTGLEFDFGGGMTFTGVVDAYKNFSFTGDIEAYETEETFDTGSVDVWARLEVSAQGAFVKRSGCWEMSGELTVLVDENGDELDFNDCTLTGPLKSTQIEGGTCDGLF